MHRTKNKQTSGALLSPVFSAGGVTKSILLQKILFEIYSWLSLQFIFPSYYYGGPTLFVAQTFLAGGACYWDWHIGDTMKNNVDRIVARGLVRNRFEVLFAMYMTILTSQSIALTLAILSGCFQASAHYDFQLARNVVYCILFNEAVFSTSHRYFLHGTELGGKIHQIHHTCRPSSFSTSFIFHFWDSNTEFTASFCCMAAFCNFFLKDPFALLCSLHIGYLWYSVGDHSENLKLGHFWHHHFINSNYTAYTDIRYFWPAPKTDFVRERVFSDRKD
uniref:Fatty acid hydroxylase domain-containing protein n=1 Tax=Ditylum brightwellii TaxID=49249 RepID=A0A6V2QDJ2_9STRA|mmetsp:Transcript_1446/g.1985  ORF Transcript_1446/g.1985 Transcript_1446/m.1985 type:complete len:276 (-) Transcript_1446:106-933(-)